MRVTQKIGQCYKKMLDTRSREERIMELPDMLRVIDAEYVGDETLLICPIG